MLSVSIEDYLNLIERTNQAWAATVEAMDNDKPEH
jgi:hypothetical protein